MNDLVVRRALRTIGIAIAIAAAFDPAITSNRTVKPVVIVSAGDSIRDASLVDRVAKSVGTQFTVSRSPIAGASAAVLVGDALPSGDDDVPMPTFVVGPDSTTPSVSIDRVDAPNVAPSDARVPVTVRVDVHGASGRSLEATLRSGASVADRFSIRLGSNDSSLIVPLAFVPTAPGASALRVTAALSGVRDPAVADAAVNVLDQRWAVLFFDPRPSWTSTFVRRAIERDPRFVVTSRVVTSRGVSTEAGRPPAKLDDLTTLSLFDAIVVGAPEGLSAADVAGLDSFMRRRGGSVVLLLDQRTAGPYDRLTSVPSWSSASVPSAALAGNGRDSAMLRATEIAWPSALPAGATTIAGGARPVVWEAPVGAGRLVISGALDAWRFRDPSTSGFEHFWRSAIADAAAAAPPPVSITLSTPIARPGDRVGVRAMIRDALLQPALTTVSDTRSIRASVTATIAGRPLRLWPAGNPGEFRGTFHAPRAVGVHRIVVTGNATVADVPLIVSNDVRRPERSARDVIAAWALVRGGRALGATDVDRLPSMLNAAVRPPSRTETWHPMRSAWWILPFVLALSGEWWLRRRRGLP